MNTKDGWSQRHKNKLDRLFKSQEWPTSILSKQYQCKKDKRLWELMEWSPTGKGFDVIKFSQPNLQGNLFEKFELPCYVFVKNFNTLATG